MVIVAQNQRHKDEKEKERGKVPKKTQGCANAKLCFGGMATKKQGSKDIVEYRVYAAKA